jgi:hypothetical protein
LADQPEADRLVAGGGKRHYSGRFFHSGIPPNRIRWYVRDDVRSPGSGNDLAVAPHLFLDRLLLVAVMHLAVALTATLVFAATWHAENLALAVVRWLADGIALAGVAVFTTQVTRQGIFGTLLSTLLWAASLYGGDSILKVWKWFWPFHIYLQPEKFGLGIYLLNRLVLIGIGLGLFLLAMKFLGNEDRLLGTR